MTGVPGRASPIAVAELVIDSDERLASGGFLQLRRLRLRNRRPDGSTSRPYVCDFVVRPYGQDSVVVAVYARIGGVVHVLVRECLRPAIGLGREAQHAPIAEDAPPLFLTELVAGIIEVADRGAAGLASRAVDEVGEEAGFAVDAAAIELLGAGMLPSPGVSTEKHYFCAAEVQPSAQSALVGDGSPMEEGASTRWLPLAEAIAMCVRGDIVDLKTEVGLRRLRERLG